MKARDLMTPNPVCCADEDSVIRAVEIMKREDTGVVPIMDRNDRCVGVITDRDICLEILNNLDFRNTPLSRIMHTNLLTCGPEDDVREIVQQMKRRQVKRILVTEGDRCVGIISEADIARHENREVVGELAEGIYG